ncbi:ribonuclease HII [Candidatus Saccharibacteria bacterium]|nr:ribonuclease HII [Candidatus Saccharibacteria bacterium]MBR3378221.1 ribonuclease HII [Candidatus Saccharibacteria bacterium]
MKKLLGIDEVGRGPWAGPLVVGACVLREPIEGLNDSKKLTPKRRKKLATEIHEKAYCGLGWVSAAELDKLGLSASLRKACREAVKAIQAQKPEFNEIIIDGTINFLSDTPLGKYVAVLPKADALVPEVSAASIIAKVARDNYMIELAEHFPGYGFEKHVGYGTATHKAALLELGPCEEHRKSFRPIAELIGSKPQKIAAKNVTDGRRGEESAADYLERLGHKIVERNWKTKWCEIDIVSEKDDVLYFSEVKYRKRGDGLDAITPAKQKQMRFAAEMYLQKCPSKSARLAAIAVNGDYVVTDFLVLE